MQSTHGLCHFCHFLSIVLRDPHSNDIQGLSSLSWKLAVPCHTAPETICLCYTHSTVFISGTSRVVISLYYRSDQLRPQTEDAMIALIYVYMGDSVSKRWELISLFLYHYS